MLSFPNCKINLGLNITSKRADGFHNIETVFYPVQLNDILEIVQADELKFTSTGLPISGAEESNLCMKAYHLLKQDYARIPPIHIHLHKVIPMGAGLGGGSSDGAFMLALLNNKFSLEITKEQLTNYALLLGSDCPFFVVNKPSFATGRGEILAPINVDLTNYKILLVNPKIHVSTKEAFAGLVPKLPVKTIADNIRKPVEAWKDILTNDFENTLFKQHPDLKLIKDDLYKKGAVYASMTGTGSTLYGIFRLDQKPNVSLFAAHFYHWV